MPDRRVHLLDVNLAVAILDQRHHHHPIAKHWFDTPGLQWAVCAFAEAGVLRFFMRPVTGGLSMQQAAAMLERFKQKPGFRLQAITADWHRLTAPFAHRIHGHQQITDAYLLGLALHENVVLATFDKALLHLAGEHADHVLVLSKE